MGFNALRLLDPEPCRPFDAARRGMSIGEGAGFVVLEDAAHPGARGARIYAQLPGSGMTTDAFPVPPPQPRGEGMAPPVGGAPAPRRARPAAGGYGERPGPAAPRRSARFSPNPHPCTVRSPTRS